MHIIISQVMPVRETSLHSVVAIRRAIGALSGFKEVLEELPDVADSSQVRLCLAACSWLRMSCCACQGGPTCNRASASVCVSVCGVNLVTAVHVCACVNVSCVWRACAVCIRSANV